MRRKWPVLTAAIPLAFGWALVAAHPAAASIGAGVPGPGGQVQPGGPVSQLSQPGGTFPGAPTGIVTPQASGGQSGTSGQNTSVSSSNARALSSRQ